MFVYNQTKPLQQPLQVEFCDSFATRLRGLMFRRKIGAWDGILLVEPRDSRLNTAIHMFFMNFDIATVWVNTSGRVVDTCLAKRWRPFYMPSAPARYTLETHPSRLNDFSRGDQIVFENAPQH
jgi:uncharacterized membrane protein (UPF0127 family)